MAIKNEAEVIIFKSTNKMTKQLQKSTGRIFNNRKEAKDQLGNSYYRLLISKGDIIFINDDYIAFDESIYQNTAQIL